MVMGHTREIDQSRNSAEIKLKQLFPNEVFKKCVDMNIRRTPKVLECTDLESGNGDKIVCIKPSSVDVCALDNHHTTLERVDWMKIYTPDRSMVAILHMLDNQTQLRWSQVGLANLGL